MNRIHIASMRKTPADRAALAISSAWRRIEGERFLAQHCLAGGDGIERVAVVELVGGRHIHGVDRVVGEEVVIAAVGGGDLESFGKAFRPGGIARPDGGDPAPGFPNALDEGTGDVSRLRGCPN